MEYGITLRPAVAGKNNEKIIDIQIEGSLPLIITRPADIQNLTLTSEVSPTVVADDFELSDPEVPNRYSLLTVAKSPITQNIVAMYYDTKHEDIIILPDMSSLLLCDEPLKFNVRGYRLGYNGMLGNNRPYQVLSIDNKHNVKLPNIAGQIEVKSHLVMIPGIAQSNLVRNDTLETMLDAKNNFCKTTVQPSILIELGTAATVFKTVSKLPLYMLAQTSIREYQLHYLNNTAPGTNPLYLSLFF